MSGSSTSPPPITLDHVASLAAMWYLGRTSSEEHLAGADQAVVESLAQYDQISRWFLGGAIFGMLADSKKNHAAFAFLSHLGEQFPGEFGGVKGPGS